MADSYYNWMLSHIQKLEAGEYSVSDGIISLFPTEGVKGVGVAVTKDIKVPRPHSPLPPTPPPSLQQLQSLILLLLIDSSFAAFHS